MMKKLLAVAMLLAAVANVEAGFFGGRCGKNRCERVCKTERVCEPVNCLRPACVVDCVTNVCEGPKPQLCALEPARVDIIKNVDTTISYTCAPRKGCQVAPTQEQIDELIGAGHIPADTIACK